MRSHRRLVSSAGERAALVKIEALEPKATGVGADTSTSESLSSVTRTTFTASVSDGTTFAASVSDGTIFTALVLDGTTFTATVSDGSGGAVLGAGSVLFRTTGREPALQAKHHNDSDNIDGTEKLETRRGCPQ
jgi:hypothetical protein